MGPCVATIGTFDGIHLGHQAIVAQVKQKSAVYRLPSVAMIFEPHPREYFTREQAPARLMRLREKVQALHGLGIDTVFCLQFNRRLRNLDAREFIRQVLVEGIHVRCLVVGDDFRFGCDREGDSRMLRETGRESGFEVVDTCTIEQDGRRISSSWVREELEAGNFARASQLLGKAFRLTGRVIRGQRLGSRLGVPTANINLRRYRAPLSGVFVVEALVDGQWLPGVANVGVRPTVDDLIEPLLEVHLLDWSGDLYGRRIEVQFLEKIREEKQFSGLDELVAGIQADIRYARDFFERTG